MLGIAAALGVALLMGTASIFSRRGLEYAPFDVMVVVSLVVSAPIFVVVAVLTTGFHDAPVRGLVLVAAAGVVRSLVARSCYFLGINYVGPGKSLSISATSPLFGAVLAVLVLGERVTPMVLVGTAVLVLGVVAISRDARAETDREGHSPYVVLFPLAGAVLLAGSVTLRKLALDTGLAPIEAAAVNMTTALLVAVPVLVGARRERFRGVDRRAIRQFVVASLLMTAGFGLYFTSLSLLDASVFFPVVQTQPLIAVALSGLFLEDLELVTRRTVAAAGLIVAGAALVVVG